MQDATCLSESLSNEQISFKGGVHRILKLSCNSLPPSSARSAYCNAAMTDKRSLEAEHVQCLTLSCFLTISCLKTYRMFQDWFRMFDVSMRLDDNVLAVLSDVSKLV